MVQQAVTDLQLPPEIRVVYGGTYAEQQKSFKDLLVVLGLAVILVTLPCCCSNSAHSPRLQRFWRRRCLSTSGVFFALLITGITFNISSFMGLIMVIGIVAKNGILLLDADDRYRAEDFLAHDAMIEAGARENCVRILMTALATIPLGNDSSVEWPSGAVRRCCSLWRLR